MRANTQRIYDLLSRGAFLSVDSTDSEIKHLYNDIEENYSDYESYFLELGLHLEAGEGYYHFARTKEAKLNIELKLQSFAQWVDIIDFLKTYDIAFSVGFQFRSTSILERINLDVELKEKARKLFKKQNTNQEVVEKLINELTSMGFVENINEQDGTYKVIAAFRYAENLVGLITIYNEEETPEA
ncbi:MAG: hypothetical protein MJZ16_07170 [Bacteroidales bacterium]|nr:hypothetical protein [Bacteroidales bacterium]